MFACRFLAILSFILYRLTLHSFSCLEIQIKRIYLFVLSYSREFTHRVKSVSMAKFTSQEVDALQKGGNQVSYVPYFFVNIIAICGYSFYAILQRARELYLKAWDSNRQRLPDNRFKFNYVVMHV